MKEEEYIFVFIGSSFTSYRLVECYSKVVYIYCDLILPSTNKIRKRLTDKIYKNLKMNISGGADFIVESGRRSIKIYKTASSYWYRI